MILVLTVSMHFAMLAYVTAKFGSLIAYTHTHTHTHTTRVSVHETPVTNTHS